MPSKPSIPRSCEHCGQTFYTWPSKIRVGKGRFCSQSCSAKSRLGERAGNWRGGRSIHEAGYIILRRNGVDIYEHRAIMEEILDRPLHKWEIVHHVDGDKSNNDPSNLQVMTQSEHVRLHTPAKGRGK